ncbi:MAG: pantoate--beta-alanine ligase [Candidatus Methylophosphatis roskildensis]
MQTHLTIASLRAALDAERDAGKRIAFVPTMGNLHEGHITLMHRAINHGASIVSSIFVNRLQFGPTDDFERYPRTFEADCAKLVEAGVHHLFAPDEQQLYPSPQKFVVEPDPFLQTTLEGEFRPGHFHGVATVVLKLFNIVQPHAALFGKKDYQQFLVLSAMVRELNLRIEVLPGDTVRDPDGLALSSRNGYLSDSERAEAPRLYRLLSALREKILAGNRDFDTLQAEAMAELASHGWAAQYVAVRRRSDLQSPSAQEGGLVILAAAFLGKTRLIDNLEV